MKFRTLLFSLAMLFVLAANLNLCCRVGVNGAWDDTLYALGDARRSELAARATAEEILPRQPRWPEIEHRVVLSLRPPQGDSRCLSARILSQVPGVSSLYAVRVGERSFGVVADADKLEERLRSALYGSMPPAAARASYSVGIEISPVYGRSGSAMLPSDMALAVSGAVPAVFYDSEGNLIAG